MFTYMGKSQSFEPVIRQDRHGKQLFSRWFQIALCCIGLLLMGAVVYGEVRIYQEVELLEHEQRALKSEIETVKVLRRREETQQTQESAQKEKVDTSNWQVYRSEEYGVELKYPLQWKIQAEDSVIEFYPPGRERGDNFGYRGDITLWFRPNSEELSVQGFYNGVNDVDFFSDADDYKEIRIGDQTGIKFMHLKGISGSSIAVIRVPDKKTMLELRDVYDVHIADGIFDTMLYSIQFR